MTPMSDIFALGTTGLGTSALFFFSSIISLSFSYSAMCKCRVNSFAVSRNSSSTIIHSSSRRSNLEIAPCICSTRGCSRSPTRGGGDDETSRRFLHASFVLDLVPGVDGSAGRLGRSSSDSLACRFPLLLLAAITSSKKSSSSSDTHDTRSACGIVAFAPVASFFAHGSRRGILLV